MKKEPSISPSMANNPPYPNTEAINVMPKNSLKGDAKSAFLYILTINRLYSWFNLSNFLMAFSSTLNPFIIRSPEIDSSK